MELENDTTTQQHLKGYYVRFNLRPAIDPNCEYCGTIEDISHITETCREPQRKRGREILTSRLNNIQKAYPSTKIDINNKTLVRWLNERRKKINNTTICLPLHSGNTL